MPYVTMFLYIPLGDVPADEGYQLESVHIVIRHGDRYHMHGLPNYENAQVDCKISRDLLHEVPAMQKYKETMEAAASIGGRKPRQTYRKYDIYPNKKDCAGSHLTPEGAAQHVKNGLFLSERYLSRWNLLDRSNRDIWDQVLIRCTTWSRTFQSAMALMFGFLPEFEITKMNIESAEDNSMCTKNSPLPCRCASIKDYYDVFSNNWRQRSPHVMTKAKLKTAYVNIAEVLGVASGSLPPPSHIMDVFMIHFCHKQPLPFYGSQCVKPSDVGGVYDSVMENGREQVKDPILHCIVRLKLLPLMLEIAKRMSDQLQGDSTSPRFVLYSGHDSTVEPLANAFGFSTGIWARYAARIVLELYSKEETTGKTGFIRVLFDGRVVTQDVIFCRENMANGKYGLCPLQSFLDFTSDASMSDLGGGSYASLCKEPIPYM